MSKKYIHYGNEEFKREKFEPIKNRSMMAKPLGGFWASPVDSERSWKEFCERDGVACDMTKSFTFSLSENARVLSINSVDDLAKLPVDTKGPNSLCLALGLDPIPDFEELAKNFDAIEVSISSDGRLYDKLYGWDVDSICIFNPEVIVVG